MHRLVTATALFATAVLIAVGLLLPVVRPVPTVIDKHENGADVHIVFDATTVLFDWNCVTVHWHIEHIQSIQLNGRGVPGTGDRRSCSVPATVSIVYQDGSSDDFTIPIQVLSSSLIARLLMAAAPWLISAAVYASGLLPRLWKPLKTSPLSISIGQRLPRVDYRRIATPSWGIFWTAVVIVLIGAAVRSHFLSRPFGSDEARTYISFASRPLAQGLTEYWIPNNHLFNTFLIHESIGIFGAQLWTIRLPVFFAGVLSIAAAFAVGRQFYGSGAGLLTAALVAGSAWLIEYSVNARGYTLITLCFLLLLRLAASLRRRRSTARWLVFALFAVCGLYAVPTMVYPLAIVCLWLGLSILIENRGRQRWLLLRDLLLSLTVAAVAVALLYLPVILYLRSTPPSKLELDNMAPIRIDVVWQTFGQAFQQMWVYWHQTLPGWAGPLLVVGVLASSLVHHRLARYPISLLTTTLAVIPTLVFVESVTTYERLWLFLLPLYLLIASAGLLYLWRSLAPRRLRLTQRSVSSLAVIIALLTSAAVVQTPQRGLVEGDTWTNRGQSSQLAALYLRTIIKPDERVLCAGSCGSAIGYGMNYGIDIAALREGMKVPEQPFYVMVTGAMEPNTLRGVLSDLDLKPDMLNASTLIYNQSDAIIYRLEPKARPSSPAAP